MNSLRQPWEQQENESAQAYCAFVAYRDLRAERSIDHAYRVVTGQQGSSKRASGRFTAWSQQHEWKQRAEAYDAYMDRKIRDQIEATTVSGYSADVAAYFDRQKKLSAAAGNAAITLLTKATEGLKKLDCANLKPLELASIFRAAASVALYATNAEAVALGVDDVLKELVDRGER